MAFKKPGSKPSASRGQYNKGRPPRRMQMRRKACKFCVDHVDYVDYKATNVLRSFITDRGKILSKRITGTCARHQRQVTTAIKRAQNIAMLPVVEG